MARSHDIVYRGYDPVELEMVEAQLRAADVPYVRLGRGNAAMLGVGNYIMEQLIEVPAEHVDEARALVSAARADDDELDTTGADEDLSALDPGRSRASLKQHLTALGLSLVFPGLASAYAGFPWLGFAVLGWSFAVMVSAGNGPNPAASIVLSQVATRAIELIATQLRLRRAARAGTSAGRQIILALLCLVLLQAAYCGAAARPPLQSSTAAAARARPG
ncbi:MAG TPA: DUF2007 domain-containing protein [Polyangiales bacterium]|nr:DUF2007 domain-containing protein [Polyangiales bacterium]